MKIDKKQLKIDEVDKLLTELKSSEEEELRRNYKSAFEDDPVSGKQYYKENWQYYLINVDNIPEALARVRFTGTFSSISRIVPKSSAKSPGWRYVDVIIKEVLIQECLRQEIMEINAICGSQGGEKVFKDFERHLPNYIERINWYPVCSKLGVTLYIKN